MSVDECRRIETFSLIPEKVTHSPILLLLQFATVGHIGMKIFSFVVLPVIIAPDNVLTPHISKTHKSIVSFNEHKLELN